MWVLEQRTSTKNLDVTTKMPWPMRLMTCGASLSSFPGRGKSGRTTARVADLMEREVKGVLEATTVPAPASMTSRGKQASTRMTDMPTKGPGECSAVVRQ